MAILFAITLSSCDNNSEEEFEQGSLTCLRYSDDYQVCEGSLDSDLITGYIKVFSERSSTHIDDSLYLCGGDLSVSFGNLLHNSIIALKTENNLFCLDADSHDITWEWNGNNGIFFSWETINILITHPECRYEDFPCSYHASVKYL